MNGKYILHIGCHQHTLMSRDVDNPRVFDTYEEAIQNYKDTRESWHSIGYVVWFAKLTTPDGKETLLESNPYY